MRVAALDLGSNTFLCLIADISENGELTVLEDRSEVVRLGQDVDKSGEFHPEALSRARACLSEFKKVIDAKNVDHVLAAATSAARDAKNGHELFAIGNDLGIPIEIILGDDEARVSFQGATLGLSPKHRRMIIDIGGGSTELIVGKDQQIEEKISFDIGGVRLTERFITQQPVPLVDQKNLEEYIQTTTERYLQKLQTIEIEEVIAVAGTPTSIAAIELGGFDAMKIDSYDFPVERLDYWKNIFATTTVEEKKTRYQLGGRADIIFAGTAILSAVLHNLKMKSFRVSTKGVRYGVAMEIFRRFKV